MMGLILLLPSEDHLLFKLTQRANDPDIFSVSEPLRILGSAVTVDPRGREIPIIKGVMI
jgi:hypothetical protein